VSKLIFQKSFDSYEYEVWDDAPVFSFCEVNQVHGKDICEAKIATKDIDGDGIYTLENKFTPMAIRTADCVPIVLIGDDGAAILHAGWKGVKEKILEHPLLSKIKIHTIFLGPYISVNHYEVQGDFQEHFPDQRFYQRHDQKCYFNMGKALQAQMPTINLQDSSICTFENTNFNSFRRDKTTKRNYNILKPRG
jgi:copper oxidase (laccase) domain-containing protein